MKITRIRGLTDDILVARYNFTAWKKTEENVILIGREVTKAGGKGQPDEGVLKLFEVGPEGDLLSERVIWTPGSQKGVINLEDPRALELPNDNIVIGLTAVFRDRWGRPAPYPAIVRIDSHVSWGTELPPIILIFSFGEGKNLTPIDNHTFLFRPESKRYHHKLMVFTIHHANPEKLADIKFPKDLTWANFKIGTTMPPIWITPDEGLFIIHGISALDTPDGVKYIYSIGRAMLSKKNSEWQVKVAPEPLLTPDDFLNENGEPLVEELHPKLRRVVYSCGGIVKRHQEDILYLYVNVGDRATFEVQFPVSELKEGLF
jgi:predicted GH43/DUF377 family glycosyl hydrolase